MGVYLGISLPIGAGFGALIGLAGGFGDQAPPVITFLGSGEALPTSKRSSVVPLPESAPSNDIWDPTR